MCLPLPDLIYLFPFHNFEDVLTLPDLIYLFPFHYFFFEDVLTLPLTIKNAHTSAYYKFVKHVASLAYTYILHCQFSELHPIDLKFEVKCQGHLGICNCKGLWYNNRFCFIDGSDAISFLHLNCGICDVSQLLHAIVKQNALSTK